MKSQRHGKRNAVIAAVECPQCHAPPGIPCSSHGNQQRKAPHRERASRFKELPR